MGSGAFLVAACRLSCTAAEDALIREGRWHPGDVTPPIGVALRREVALRCLYGVDLNPIAVQLARLSLWLATLAADKPLSFLDHHLVTGDSLVGATPDDVQRQPRRLPVGAGARSRCRCSVATRWIRRSSMPYESGSRCHGKRTTRPRSSATRSGRWPTLRAGAHCVEPLVASARSVVRRLVLAARRHRRTA